MWKRAALGLAAVCVALTFLAGCDDGNSEAAEEDLDSLPSKLSFEVDGKGVYYLTYDVLHEKQPADTLADIPIAQRGAVGIHASGKTPEKLPADHTYRANLLGAEPGDSMEATLAELETVKKHNDLGRKSAKVARSAASTAKLGALRRSIEKKRGGGGGDGDSEGPSGAVVEKTSIEVSGRDSGKGDDREVHSTGSQVEIQKIDEEYAGVSRGGRRQVPGRNTGGNNTAEWEPEYRSVVMFGAEWCEVCTKARRWLDRKGISYQWRDVDSSGLAYDDMERFCNRKGRSAGTLPTFKIGGDRIMQGWNPSQFKRIAAKN